MMESIQIPDGICEESFSKAEFQDILKFFNNCNSRRGFYFHSHCAQSLFQPLQWLAILLAPAIALRKKEQDQQEKRANLLSQDNENLVVAQVAEKNLWRHHLPAKKRFLLTAARIFYSSPRASHLISRILSCEKKLVATLWKTTQTNNSLVKSLAAERPRWFHTAKAIKSLVLTQWILIFHKHQ